MVNLVVHEYRWFKKGSYYITLWIISIFKGSIFKMFENASKKLDTALWYKKHTHGFVSKKYK